MSKEEAVKKKQTKPWTDLEKYALIRSNNKDFPVLAKIMGRSVKELQEKWEELEEGIMNDEECQDKESRTKRHAWYIQKDGFWRWIVEKVLGKRWKRMPSDGMHYYGSLSQEERKNLLDQWEKEAKEYIEELKQKGLV